MTMKHIVVSLLVLPAVLGYAEEDAALEKYVHGGAEVNFYSAYVWRGQVLIENPVWQPAANLFLNLGEEAEYGYLKARLWANFLIERNRAPRDFAGMTIVDETVSYNVTFFDALDVEAGHIGYQYPTRRDMAVRDTDEFLLGFRYRNPILTPAFYVWWDYGRNSHNDTDTLYYDFNFTRAFSPVEKLTLTPGYGFGVGNEAYLENYTKGEVHSAAFNNMHLDLVADYAFYPWLHVGASVSYFWYPSSHVRESCYNRSERYRDGILRGGIHLRLLF